MAKAGTLDPVLQDILAQPGDPNATPVEEQTPEEARAEFAADMRAVDGPQPEIAESKDFEIPGPGGSITLRSYLPDGMQDVGPLLVYYHGGGNIRGSIETHDSTCRVLANAGCFAVLSVDYRLAPETRFPGAPEDCYAATVWAVEHAEELGVDASKLAVAGTSAGGNLSAAVSLMARDRGGPNLSPQVLVCPVIDFRFDRPSYIENADGFGLTRDGMIWYWEQYLGPDGDGHNPYASPIRAENLAGLPDATIIAAEYDPLFDEAADYAAALKTAGVDATFTRYPGMIHGFNGSFGLVDAARDACDEASNRILASFAEL